MKNKAPLSLMEQLVMLLVFALAAALCLQVFVLSSQISRRCEAMDHAVTKVQNVAEYLKASGGDLTPFETTLNESNTAPSWQICYDENWNQTFMEQAAYRLLLTPVMSEDPLLGSAQVCAMSKTGDILFAVTVCWQEAFCD